jgi:hypothetical protein
MLATQLKLRTLGLASLVLLLVWAFSPFGGQATLRIVQFKDVSASQSLNLLYMNLAESTYRFTEGDVDSGIEVVNAAFVSTLASPLSLKALPMDPWGNLKVPMIESLSGVSPDKATGWITVNQSTSTPVYSSLIGIGSSNLPQTGNTSFNLETAYWTLSCPIVEKLDAEDYIQLENMYFTAANGTNTTLVGIDSVFQGYDSPWGWIISSQDGQDVRCNSAAPNLPLRMIQYASKNSDGSSGPTASAVNCTIQTSHVELAVLCSEWSCSVDQMRQSTVPHPPPAQTAFDECNNPPGYDGIFTWFSTRFTTSVGSNHNGIPSALQTYFQQPGNPFNETFIYQSVDLTQVSSESFSTSLAQLLNTYWLASLQSNILFSGHPNDYGNLSSIHAEPTGTNPSVEPLKYSLTNGTSTVISTQFTYSRGWMAALVLSTALMFLAALFKLAMDLMILTPHLLMNISTLTRVSSANFANIPPGGSALSDAARSRMLRNEMVRFGDVGGAEKDVGELGIGAIVEDGGQVMPIQMGRLYS